MSDIEFVNGLLVKAPKENAPDYVKASISINRDNLLDWLGDRNEEWINIQVKESKGGKWYAAVDNWKPDRQGGSQGSQPARNAPRAPANDFDDDENLPF